jgi:hypothetical protein
MTLLTNFFDGDFRRIEWTKWRRRRRRRRRPYKTTSPNACRTLFE